LPHIGLTDHHGTGNRRATYRLGPVTPDLPIAGRLKYT